MKNTFFLYYKYGAVLFLAVFATIQFFLILRHKSPYLSDSYFYKHIYYQFKGYNFDQAYEKVKGQIYLAKEDEIGRNIFSNSGSYKNSYSFFTKRPLYPYTAYLLDFIFKNEYVAFLTPVFLSYLGVILLVFYFSNERFNYLFASLTTAFFIAFYPFLDWSTYFLTDTIGAFFWFLQLFFIYKFLKDKKTIWLSFYLLFLVVSLLNREQSLLMVFTLSLVYFLTIFSKPKIKIDKIKLMKIFLLTLVFSMFYILSTFWLKQRSLLDTIVYTANSYGLNEKDFSQSDLLAYQLDAILKSHFIFFRDLVSHHWWFALSFLSILGLIETLFFRRKTSLVDLLIFSSGIASYLSIYFYPVLSYRFFYPTVFMIIYFAIKLFNEYFDKRQIFLKK